MKYWLFFCLVFSGCATAPPAGVRSDFRTAQVNKVTVAPSFSLDTFGVDSHERRVIERGVETDTVEWLRRAGFAVDSPKTLEASLAGDWHDIYDAWYRGVELNSLFEAGAPEFEGAEIPAIRRVGKMPQVGSVLMVQVLYQADSVCRGDVREFVPYAVMQAVDTNPYLCTLSHLEAKLIDPRTGEVMWHNKAYVELAGPPSATIRRQALREAVGWLLGSSDGLLKMLSTPAESVP